MSEKMIIEGYPIVFDQPTCLWKTGDFEYYEIIDSRALDAADYSDVVLNYNHNDEYTIAVTKNKSLNLSVDSIGLKMRAEIANISQGRDIYELVKGKYIDKMSFRFFIEEDSYDQPSKNIKIRTITKIRKIYDVSCVTFPAYPQTFVYVSGDSERRDFLLYKAKRTKELHFRQKKLYLKEKYTTLQEIEELEKQKERILNTYGKF